MQSQTIIPRGNTQSKRSLYQRNARYGTNIDNISQMEQQQKRRKQRQVDIQRNDVILSDVVTDQQGIIGPLQSQQQKQRRMAAQRRRAQEQAAQRRRAQEQAAQRRRAQEQAAQRRRAQELAAQKRRAQEQALQLKRAQEQALQRMKAQRQRQKNQQAIRLQMQTLQTGNNQQTRRQQIRTLIKDLGDLNPKYYWEGIGVGRSGYTATLPIATQILFELSNRSQLNASQINQINNILAQKQKTMQSLKV